MATRSPGLGIPLLQSGQSNPDITHNEAVYRFEMMTRQGVESIGDNSPPGSPAEGDMYVVGTSPTGAWANYANAIAGYFNNGWIFMPGDDDNGTPIEMGYDHLGMTVWDKATAARYVFTDSVESPTAYQWLAE